jgi:hypothetical protein
LRVCIENGYASVSEFDKPRAGLIYRSDWLGATMGRSIES